MYFRQLWRDPRLSWEKISGPEKIVLGGTNTYPIWTPDTFFVNEKESHTHQELLPNTFVRILKTGELLLSKR